MEFEPELKAMNDVYDALKDLEDEAKKRVIDWVIGKFSLGQQKRKLAGALEEASEESGAKRVEFTSFKSVADLFAKRSATDLKDVNSTLLAPDSSDASSNAPANFLFCCPKENFPMTQSITRFFASSSKSFKAS